MNKQTKADELAQREAETYTKTATTDKRSRHIKATKNVYSPSVETRPQADKELDYFLDYARDSERDSAENLDKKRIIPQPLGLLSPLGAEGVYKPSQNIQDTLALQARQHRRELHEIIEGIAPVTQNPENNPNSPNKAIFSPLHSPQESLSETDTSTDETENISWDSEEETQEHNQTPEPIRADQLNPESDTEVQQEENIPEIVEQNINMAVPQNPIDIAGVIQNLQGNNNDDRQQAMIQLAQFVQQINQPPPARPQVPRMTLREALNHAREGAADDLKITDLMPDSWGGIKDGDPESHCVRFENYAAIQGYEDDQTKTAWFQATLKGEALNWITAENEYATWPDLRRAFIMEFENQPSRNVAITNFRNITWNGTERASAYLQRLKKSARLINANDEEVMVQFQIGLPKAVKLFFGATNPLTLRDMTQTLQKYLELHGPVAVSASGANQALNTIAEVLTGGMANPFMQNSVYQRTYQPPAETLPFESGEALRRITNHNSMLTPMIVEQGSRHQRTQPKHTPEKRVRFYDKSYDNRSPDPGRRIRYQDAYDDSGTSNAESADDTDKEDDPPADKRHYKQRPYDNKPRQYENKRFYPRDQGQRQYPRRNSEAQSHSVSDEMAKLMPMMAAMANINQRRGNNYNGENNPNQFRTNQERPRFRENYDRRQNTTRQGTFQNNGNYRTNTRPRVPPGDGKCYYCNTYGHYRDECRKMQREATRNTEPSTGPRNGQPSNTQPALMHTNLE